MLELTLLESSVQTVFAADAGSRLWPAEVRNAVLSVLDVAGLRRLFGGSEGYNQQISVLVCFTAVQVSAMVSRY